MVKRLALMLVSYTFLSSSKYTEPETFTNLDLYTIRQQGPQTQYLAQSSPGLSERGTSAQVSCYNRPTIRQYIYDLFPSLYLFSRLRPPWLLSLFISWLHQS